MSITKSLVDYIVDTDFEDFPSEVIAKIKLLILDAVGCGLGGTQTKLGQIFIDIAKSLGGKPESSIIGSDLVTNCARAAFTNALPGGALRSLKGDDTLSSRLDHTAFGD